MQKPKIEKEGNFFDNFEKYMNDHDEWRRTTILGRLDKLWWSIKNAVTRAYWFVRYETTDRYHFVDIRGPDYRRGYLDYNEVFIRAAFRCLEMMEEEDWGWKNVTEDDLQDENDPDDPWAAQANVGMRAQIALYKEFKDLLKWWREVRPTLHKRREGEGYLEAEARAEKEEKSKLMRLVELRMHMWA